jgi:hypothetical protein
VQVPIKVEALSVAQLENLVENHRRKRAPQSSLYIEALSELEKRKGKGLDFDKSLSIILRAAGEGQFLSYRDLASGSGAAWNQVRFAMNDHPWKLVELQPPEARGPFQRHRRERCERRRRTNGPADFEGLHRRRTPARLPCYR